MIDWYEWMKPDAWLWLYVVTVLDVKFWAWYRA